ncbi:FixH family protein [Flavobacterium laiguense]|uniref:Cytochrome C oxidase Cbb3 n=1 Tax=Flavobacterium laiguense TaxID=2169409 RepID=A0A2U1K1N0_9FLAO|nr:FixH family protein [Flavobacterium laiguense]PWA10903.1 cytochrome C oxidase Cbb3 [Flavobacterium laiguense]
MKINWGTSIVIAFALFMSFILYFVLKVQSDSKYDNELVVEEYYKHDVHFQDEMARIQNAHDLKAKPVITIDANGINIVFPADFIPNDVKGIVALYRPSNKKFDFQVPISLSNSSMSIPKSKLIGGVWDVNMEWQYNGKLYLTKEEIYVK